MIRRSMGTIVAVIPWLAPGLAAAQGDIRNNSWSGLEALTRGQLFGELRPRYNRIIEEADEDVTRGGTYRARLGWRTAPWAGWRATIEGIHTDHFDKHFNDDPGLLATSAYPLLPDPRYTGVNQAHVEYAGDDGLRVRAGRQVVRLENSRFVSDNDFRQIPQVFDGVHARYDGFERVQLEAGYFTRVRTTSGVTNALKLATLRAAWNPWPDHVVSTYAVFHQQPRNGAFTGFEDNSYRVLGARIEGAFRTGAGLDVPYVLEGAHQDKYAGGDARIDARYWRAGAGLAQARWTVRYDHEVKGSNRGVFGLETPLTDFYAFNGWTLNFFNTPRAGLVDRWLTGRYAVGPVTFYGEAHRFHADFGGAGLGRENDFGLTVDLGHDATLRLQHARYDSPPGATADIRKTWATLSWNF